MTEPVGAHKLILRIRRDLESIDIRLVSVSIDGQESIFESQEFLDESAVRILSEKIGQQVSIANLQGRYRVEGESLDLLGQHLFQLVFSMEIGAIVRDSQAEFLLLDIEEGLLEIPWELAHDGHDFLCCRFSVGRAVASWTHNGNGSKERKSSEKLSFLFLSNPTGDLPEATAEADVLTTLLENEESVQTEWLNYEVNRQTISDWLADFDAVHYCGHTVFSANGIDEVGWVLRDGVLGHSYFEDCRRLGHRLPRLVFSNSCLSSQITTDAERGVWNIGLPQEFLSLGCLHYIGSLSEVVDKHGKNFARTFYQRTLHGEPIGKALRGARLETRFSQTPNDLTWAQYVLYGDPSTGINGEKTILPEVRTLLLAGSATPTSIKESIRNLLPMFPEAELITSLSGVPLIVFARPSEAVRFALKLQARSRQTENESLDDSSLRVCIGSGEVFLERAEGSNAVQSVHGFPVRVLESILQLAGKGQILATRPVFDNTRVIIRVDEIPEVEQIGWRNHGFYRFIDLEETIEICEIGEENLSPLTPPQDTKKSYRHVLPEHEPILGWRPAAGLIVPNRIDWVLERNLGEGGFGEVWLAKNKDNSDQRVFKFCFLVDRLRALKREVTVIRLIKETLGNRDDIGKIYRWNFEDAPFFLEAEYTEGGDLKDWADHQGGPSKIPMETRIELIAEVASALAAAHSVGVIHKDIKASNVLIRRDLNGSPHAVLSDFGIGVVEDRALFEGKGITVTGMTLSNFDSSSSMGSGTRLYMAPEIIEGKAASTPADIYALGVLLYQAICGDFSRALAWGWERDVEDELLREDIAACVEGNPEFRLASAVELAKRLRSLDQRREELDKERRTEQALIDFEKAKKQRRALIFASIFGILFTTVVVVLAVIAHRDRQTALIAKDEAEEQRALANEQRDVANQQLYLIHLKRADEALLSGKYTQCQDELQSCPKGCRGWEWRYLKNCVEERFPLQLAGAENPIFTSDGKRLISAGMIGAENENDAIVWDLKTGQAIQRFNHDSRVAHCALAPHEKFLAVGELTGRLVLWDLETEERIWSVQAHSERIDGLAFSPDGQSIASVGFDGFMRLWNVEDAARSLEVKKGGHVTKVVFSPDGKRVVVGGLTQNETTFPMEIRSATSGKTLTVLPEAQQKVMDYSPDGMSLATGGIDGMIRIYDSNNGEEKRAWKTRGNRIETLEYNSDGTKIASAGYGPHVEVWDSSEGRLIDSTPKDNYVWWLSFDPLGDTIAFFTEQQGIRLWNLASDQGSLSVPAYGKVARTISFSPDNRFLASIGSDKPNAAAEGGEIVRLWDATNGKEVSIPDETTGTCVGFGLDHEIVVAGNWSGENEFRIIDIDSSSVIKSIPGGDSKVDNLFFNRDDHNLFSIEKDLWVSVLDTKSGTEMHRTKMLENRENISKASGEPLRNAYGLLSDSHSMMRFNGLNSVGKIAATALQGAFKVELWDLDTGNRIKVIPTPGAPCYHIALSSNRKKMALVWYGWSRIVDLDEGNLDESVRLLESKGMISVDFNPEGTQLVTGHNGGAVKVWDAKSGQQLITLSPESGEKGSAVLDVEWSPDAKMIAAARQNGTIEIWRLVDPGKESDSSWSVPAEALSMGTQ